jgi:hypothetical protein
VYRFGDLSSAWMQAALRWLGVGTVGLLGVAVVASGAWFVNALTLGRQYERRRAAAAAPALADSISASPAASAHRPQ